MPDHDTRHVRRRLAADRRRTRLDRDHEIGLESPADVDALFLQLTAAGYAGPLAPYDAPWGQRYATVLDPDGNLTDLFAPLGS